MKLEINFSTSTHRELNNLLNDLNSTENIDLFSDCKSEINFIENKSDKIELRFVFNRSYEDLSKTIEFYNYREKNSQFKIDKDNKNKLINIYHSKNINLIISSSL